MERSIVLKVDKSMYFFIKRVFDIVCGLVGCILLIPITIMLKILYLLDGDTAPLIFTQNRIGQYGVEFKFYKFRSMIPNADEVLFKYLDENEVAREEYRINKKLHNDPRITKIGKIIRKTSLDELPQLINVLKGDMSMIGNRPYLPREKEDMQDFFDDIVSTKPGITGLWQTSGRSETIFEERLVLEKEYSEKCCLILDIQLFFKTFAVVLFEKSAK